MRRLERRLPSPKRRRAAPDGATTKLGRTRGCFSHEYPPTFRSPRRGRYGWCPIGRGAAGAEFLALSLESAKPRPRREWDNPLASQPDSLARLAYALRNRSSTAIHWEGRVARGLASKGGSPPDSPTAIRCSFAANPVVASAPTLRVANRVINTALSPALSGWGLRQRGVDNSIHNAPLSVWGLPNGNSGTSFLRLRVPFATVANRYCQQRGGSGPLWVGPTPRPPLTNLIDNLRSARNDHPMTVQHLIGDPRLRLQGNSNPPTTHRVPTYRETRTPLQGRKPIRAGRFPP